MVQQQNFGVNLWKIPAILPVVLAIFLSGCSLTPEPEVKVVTQIEKVTVPIVARPKPINLSDTQVYVVNASNLEQFIADFKEQNGELAFVALSIDTFENLAINISELRRYINQQKEIIVYYEKAMTPQKKPKENK
jgi:hypothetical protein